MEALLRKLQRKVKENGGTDHQAQRLFELSVDLHGRTGRPLQQIIETVIIGIGLPKDRAVDLLRWI